MVTGMPESTTTSVPSLPAFSPPNRIPVAPMSMQKILTKAIRNHAKAGNLKSFGVKGADKMGGKRGGKSSGKANRVAGRSSGQPQGSTKTK